jgi:osmoprotectant transport system permease protein
MFTASGVLASGPVIPDYGGASNCITQNKVFCWDAFVSDWSSGKYNYEARLIEHIKLTIIALVVGFIVSFLLALLAYRARWLAAPVTFLASLLYTIPSLATFFILVPITGINWWTVEIALVSYTLLTLFTNTLAGLNGVSDEVRDAATGIGLTRSQLLWRVELPLAVPAIVAGVRVAAVTTISLATIAAAIVPAGLGKPIFDALGSNNFNTAFIAAGTLAVLLALFADGLMVVVQRLMTPWAAQRRVA